LTDFLVDTFANIFFPLMPLRILTTNATRKCSPTWTMDYTILHLLSPLFLFIHGLYADIGNHCGFSCCVCLFFFILLISLVTIVICSVQTVGFIGFQLFFSCLPIFRLCRRQICTLVTRNVPHFGTNYTFK
jgi:hypothetical protein